MSIPVGWAAQRLTQYTQAVAGSMGGPPSLPGVQGSSDGASFGDTLKQVIGGHRIKIRPRDPARLGEVAALLTRLGTGEVETTGRNTLTVPVADESALPVAVGRLGEAGIAVTELSLHLPSLDEVFFTLTGRRRDGGAEPESEDAA